MRTDSSHDCKVRFGNIELEVKLEQIEIGFRNRTDQLKRHRASVLFFR